MPNSSDPSSSDRGLRSAYCEIHGLHFDPSQRGCALCLREKQGRNARSSRFVWLLLALAGVCAAGFLSWEHFGSAATESLSAEGTAQVGPESLPTIANPEVPTAVVRKVDPSPFRNRITALEAIVYRTSRAGLADGGRVASLASDLATAVAAKAAPADRAAAAGLLNWSSRLGAEEDVGYGTLDLASTRAEWERLRDRVFDDASWFRHSGPQLDAQQKPVSKTVDPEEVRSLAACARRVDGLITEGRRTSREIGELSGDYVGPEGRQVLARWKSWSRQWSDDIDRLARSLPPRPAMDDSLGLVMAHQELSAAVQELRMVTYGANDTGVPFRSERENRFESATLHLAQANQRLENLRKIRP